MSNIINKSYFTIVETTDRENADIHSPQVTYHGSPAMTVENIEKIAEILENFNQKEFHDPAEELIEKVRAFERIQSIVFVQEEFEI